MLVLVEHALYPLRLNLFHDQLFGVDGGHYPEIAMGKIDFLRCLYHANSAQSHRMRVGFLSGVPDES